MRLNTGLSVEDWDSGLPACDNIQHLCVSVRVCTGHASVRAFLGEWVATENLHQAAHSALQRGKHTTVYCVLGKYAGMHGEIYKCAKPAKEASKQRKGYTHCKVSHRVGAFLVTQLPLVKALCQDLVL